jgi:hypothetical protein
MRTRRPRPAPATRSAHAGFRFPPDVIVLAVRWSLRYALSYRDVEELLAERGIEVDHVTIYRWVLRFTPPLAEAARPCRHAVGDRWQVDETQVKVAGQWRYVYRAIDWQQRLQLAPSAGEVRVNGWRTSDLGDRVEIRRRLGYLPQDLGLYPRFTVFEFVDYLAILKELEDPAERHRRVRSALAAVCTRVVVLWQVPGTASGVVWVMAPLLVLHQGSRHDRAVSPPPAAISSGGWLESRTGG